MTRKAMAFLAVASLAGALAWGADAPALETSKDKVSYGIGVELAGNLRRQGIEVNLDLLLRGLRDAYTGGKLLAPPEELRTAVTTYQNELIKKLTEERKALAEDNKRKGSAFLAENGKRPGVVTMPSGLQYEALSVGSGKVPTESDTVEVNFTAAHLDGRQFGASEPGKPATLKVKGAVIPGWTEGLQLMPVGSKYRFFIPAQLAYGEAGAGNELGPNETLVFDVELLAIK